jgi:hypothetical protein
MASSLAAVATLTMLAGLIVVLARTPREVARRVWLFGFVAVVAGGVTMMTTHSFIAKWAFHGDNPDGLERLMDGTAERPFVYRRLAPDIVRVVTDFVLPRMPPGALEHVGPQSLLHRYPYLWADDVWTPRKAVAFHVAYALTWAVLFATLLVGAALHRELLKSSWFEALVTATLVMSLVPLMFVGGGYVYDAPELFLWTTTLLFAIRGQFWALPVLFGLMLMNKESALLVVLPLGLIVLHRQGRGRAVAWGALLGGMGIAWLWFVRTKYAAMPGSPIDFWLPSNLAFWLRPGSYFHFASLAAPGLPSPRGANIMSLALVFLAVRFGWPSFPRDLRWATVIMAIELTPLFLASCRTDEVRNLSLLYPLIAIPAVQGVRALFDLGRGPIRQEAVKL